MTDAAPTRDTPLRRLAERAFGIEAALAEPVVAGAAMFFLVFASYFMLRPVRETMGVAGGVSNLPWLFTATFLATLVAVPLFGWLAGRVQRRRILAWTYAFFVSNLVMFAAAFAVQPDNLWVARTFYVWISVFNLLAISVAWSVMADVCTREQAKRAFALIAAGASVGGLVGPVLGVLLVGAVGHAGLLVLSAAMLAGSIFAAQRVRAWRERTPGAPEAPATHSLGGNPLRGATDVFRSPYLLGIGLFILLLATANTFLYFEQAKLVEATFPDRTDQTRVFGMLDIVVQSLTIFAQAFITGHIARKLGIGVLLVAVPVVVAGGFLVLALAPTFAVLAVVVVVRRFGEYAFVRPGREMLFTVVPVDAKYRAKSFLDTVAYRGGDVVSGWAKALIDLVAAQPAVAAVIGAVLSLAWAATGAMLGRMQARAAAAEPAPESGR